MSNKRTPKKTVRPPPRRAETGASQSRTGWQDRARGYLAHHRATAKDSAWRLLRSPLPSLLTWMAIGIALCLPATLFAGLENLRGLSQDWDGEPQMTVFVKKGARAAAIESLRDKIDSHSIAVATVLVSPEQALEQLQSVSGVGEALLGLDDNPLPTSLVIRFRSDVEPAQLEAFAATMQAELLIDDVLFDRAWVERLQQILALGERLVWALGSVLALGVILVIGNTISLAIEARRDEIVIVKLVGGTNAFVRRPFLYSGCWYGIGGGIIAVILLGLLLGLLSEPALRLAGSYSSDFKLEGIGFAGSFLLVAAGGVIGLLGAWLAVSRHLADIEPQ